MLARTSTFLTLPTETNFDLAKLILKGPTLI